MYNIYVLKLFQKTHEQLYILWRVVGVMCELLYFHVLFIMLCLSVFHA